MARSSQGITLNEWQELAGSLASNSTDLPHLEAHRTRLAELLKQAQELSLQQAALTASKQDISKQLDFLLDEGRKLATFLRVGVRQHYGNRAEKLVEFRLKPFRSRRRKTDTEAPEVRTPSNLTP
ncbi:MAG TPA: hypothetical protein VIW92_14795 [Thermoanaerobaculia bacterium]